MTDITSEIDECKFLFLADIQELGRKSLKLVVTEGLPVDKSESMDVGGVIVSDYKRIETTNKSRTFELTWNNYVGYSVMNESFASASEEEQFEGRRFRIYSKSHFLNYMTQASFASDDYPGPTRHYCVACEDHIVDVLSVRPPNIRRT